MARRANDRYLTPLWGVDVLLQHFPEVRGELLLDPCCGDGRMAAAVGQRFRRRRLNDLDTRAPAVTHLDARDPALYFGPPDWVISNPPFVLSGEITGHAVQHARSVAMLLRCTFGEPCKGREWLISRPPTALLMLPRISFTGDGKSDSAAAWWFIWSPDVRPRIVVADRGSFQPTLFAAHVREQPSR